MMLINSLLLPSSTLPHLISNTHKPLQLALPLPMENAPSIAGNSRLGWRKTSNRGVSVVTRAGPSASSLIFAFVFPLSLLVVTIVTSMRIADKLDQKFFEEFAMEQAILEAQDEDDEDEASTPARETTPVRSRNRPKKEVEPSSSK